MTFNRTADRWCWKQLRYQLGHNHCPKNIFSNPQLYRPTTIFCHAFAPWNFWKFIKWADTALHHILLLSCTGWDLNPTDCRKMGIPRAINYERRKSLKRAKNQSFSVSSFIVFCPILSPEKIEELFFLALSISEILLNFQGSRDSKYADLAPFCLFHVQFDNADLCTTGLTFNTSSPHHTKPHFRWAMELFR